jgi:hypothetical protein
MRKNKSKVCFVESSFGQKVWSTFPVALRPLSKMVPMLFAYEKQIRNFILSRAHINICSNE